MTDDSKAERHIEILRGVYDAARTQDFESILGVLDPEIVVHEAEGMPYGGVYRGLHEVMGVLGQIALHLDLANNHVEYITANDEYGVAHVRIPLLGGGSAETRVSENYRFRDFKITEMRPFYWDTAAIQAHFRAHPVA